MVEGGQKVYKPAEQMVWDNQPKGSIHELDVSHLSNVWREGMLQVFRSMDSLGIQSGYLRKQFKLGSDNFKIIEHLYTIGSDIERSESSLFPYGLVLTRCYLCEKCLCQHEFKMACCRAPCPCLF
jgi:hypothetical protein